MAAAGEPVSGEQQLIQQARDGDHDAFRILMDRHILQVYNLAYRFVRDHDSAEDVTQEAFVKVHTALRSFRGDAEFSTWLHRIVVNIALTRKRLNQKRVDRYEHFPETDVTIQDENILHVHERQAHVERALHELPTLQRAVIILRHLQGMSTKQVSSILQCSEGTVKTHLFRGLKKMRSKLEFLEEERG